MIRIRFHGRGGHGIKTASRIVGSAAFLAGYQAQDCPVYGAERRGAAVAAHTRIDHEPILERGVIDRPDLIVVGDDTLLTEPSAAVLTGIEGASAVFVNTDKSAEQLAQHTAGARSIALDLTGRALSQLGRVSTLSAPLAAAALRLSGVGEVESLRAATREELEELRLGSEVIDQNVALAEEVFAALPVVEMHSAGAAQKTSVVSVEDDGSFLGTPSILATGNSAARRTGSWRVERPEVDLDQCTRCGICFLRCPDGAIALDEHGYPIIDYDQCKGCMICLQQCPLSAIERHKEVRAW